MTITSEYEAHANGTAAQAPSTGPRLPRREVWADLPADAYPGFRIKLWINAPRTLFAEVDTEDEPRIKAALCRIVLEHNGWLDDDGTPFPAPSTPAFWDAIPNELAAVLVALIGVEAGKLATSLRPSRRGR